MSTIAELQIKVNAQEARAGKEELYGLADAAQKANDAISKGGSRPSVVPQGEPKKVADLSAAIDTQTRKLQNLADARKQLDNTGMKSTNPQEYTRLNNIIDANIALVQRQGNAVERLSEVRYRDQNRYEKQIQAELAAQERLVRATERQENVVTNATARQARQIEQTINGLDRQIKAQNEYNRAMEVLDRTRALSGMAGPGGNQMSGAEYEHLAKQAAAQRDAALAVQDNAREVERAKSKMDTYVATLGKAERAEVEYARATDVMTEALRLGLVTQTQFDARISEFAAARDKSIAAANSNAAAEERLERQLRQVMGVYDPVIRAQTSYAAAVRVLSDGLQNGIISADQFNKALTEQVAALDAVKNASTGQGKISSEYDQALNAVLPYRTELKNLELQQQRLDAAKRAGKITTAQQVKDYDDATAAIKRQTAEYRKRIEEGNNAGISFKQEQAALRGMPAQITDIVVSLQGGQAPLTVLLQQGGQIKDMFGGIGPAISGMARAVAAMITPLSVGLTVLGAFGLAAYQGSEEIVAFNRATIQMKNASGATVNDLYRLTNQLDDVTDTSGKAGAALLAMQSSGRIAGDMFGEVGAAVIQWSRATGTSVKDVVDDFASIGKDPVEAALRLDETYKFLTSSVLAQADALVRQGKEQEAVKLIQGEMASAAKDTADEIIEQAGFIERAWHGVTNAINATWTAMKNVGSTRPEAERLAKLQADQAAIIKNWYDGDEEKAQSDRRYQANKSNIEALEASIKKTQEAAAAEGAANREREKSAQFIGKLASNYTANVSAIDKVQGAQEKLNETERKIAAFRERQSKAGVQVTANEEKLLKAELAARKQELEDAKESEARKNKPKGGLDSTNLQEVKSATGALLQEYDRYYKQMDALGKANVVSEEAVYHAQMAILQAQGKALEGSYNNQISEIEKLQNKKGVTAQQSISLENQMTKAEAARTKALEDNQSKQEQLTIKFQGDMKKREDSIRAYTQALEEQVRAVREQGDRAVTNIGRGDRQGALSDRLFDADRDYAKQQRRLAEQLASNEIGPEEHARKLKELQNSHDEMTDAILENDQKIQDANFDWTNGFTKAVENAQDAGMNFASSVNTALSGAFNSAGAALGEFVTTGKFQFKDFASSIISDMAKIAAQQAAMGILGAIFGGFTGGFASGGASSLGSTASGYGPEYFPNLARNAKGGAYSGPVSRFAKGDVLTNSIVTTPTRFAIGGVNPGVGEAGEGGRPEAIMPLQRTRNGDLGVKVEGMGGNSAPVVHVEVNIMDGNAKSSSSDSNYDQFGQQLGQYIIQQVYTVINKETRPGGSLKANDKR